MKENKSILALSALTLIIVAAVLWFLLGKSWNWSTDGSQISSIGSGVDDRARQSADEPTPEPQPTAAAETGPSALSELMSRIAKMLSGRGALRNELVFEFADAAQLKAFLERAKASGLKVLDTIDRFGMARIGFDSLDQLSDYFSKNPDDAASLGANYLVQIPELPAVDERSEQFEVGFNGTALKSIGATNATEAGQGVTVAVLDTGVAAHSSLTNKVTGKSLTEGSGDLGHGTAVASIIAGTDLGVAQNASILSLGVMAADGMSDTFTIAKAITEAVDSGASIINISLGSYGDSQAVRKAVAYASENNRVIVAAAGNDQYSQLAYPAAYEGVIAVGATDALGQQLTFSNSGTNMGLAAPGYEVAAAWTDNSLVSFTGTSAAAPYVSGAIANVMAANPGLNAVQASQLLYQYADEAGAPGYDTDYGAGILNVGRVLNRNTPGIYDAAVASHYYNAQPTDGSMSRMEYIVQNRGTEPIWNLGFTTSTGGSIQEHTINYLAPGQISTTPILINSNAIKLTGGMEFESRVTLPPGTRDATPSNNQKASAIQPAAPAN